MQAKVRDSIIWNKALNSPPKTYPNNPIPNI